MKKAQGMPLQVIIIAIILLIVLAVLIFLFAGKVGIFGNQTTSCKGTCDNPVNGACPENKAPVPGDCTGNKICCLPLG